MMRKRKVSKLKFSELSELAKKLYLILEKAAPKRSLVDVANDPRCVLSARKPDLDWYDSNL